MKNQCKDCIFCDDFQKKCISPQRKFGSKFKNNCKFFQESLYQKLPVIGVKYDKGKLRYDLIPAECLEQLAKIFTFGAEKYGEHNWKSLQDAQNRYYAAMERHQQSKRMGEFYDESGLPHSAHVAVNAMFLLWFDLQKITETENLPEE